VLKQERRELEGRLQQISQSEQQLETVTANRKAEEARRIPLDTERTRLNKGIPDLSAAKAATESQLASVEKELPEEYRSLDALKRAIQDTAQVINTLESDYQAAQKRQAGASNAVSAAQSNLQALNKQLEDLQARRAAQLTSWQNALLKSEFGDQSDFERSVLDETTAESLRATIREYDTKLQSLNSQLELIAQQLADQQVPDMASLEENHKTAEAAYQKAEHTWAEAQQHKAVQDRTLAKIRSLETQQQTVQRQYEVVGKMAKAAGGRGDVRVSLERFVLGNLLDSVLSVASQRLHAMSKGQYRLVRQNEADQKRTMTAGLDLAIDDAYSGKTRPVATLSGGESFMASLALALALPDVVQQRSGGIQLDTLFIDEGFGSLDQESLQLAINTLVELQSSGRTIGIISHVSELKEQMPLRIDVSSSRTGSTVRMSGLS
jgi:exonuclease SbcC